MLSGRRRARPRLGADFAKLWTASAVSNVGDGLTLAAGPLLVASLTEDPALVGGAVFVQQLPWLLFSLPSGAYADRLDRQRLIVLVNLFRGAVVAGLAVAVWSGVATIPLVYAAFFLLGTGETLADNASAALLPSIVSGAVLPRANARLVAVHMVGNQFAGPPLGAWLFVVAAALPFGADAASFVVAAVLVTTVRRQRRPRAAGRGERPSSVGTEIAEGVRWLWRSPGLRTLAVCLGLMNLTFTGAFATWVLYARGRLGLSEVGYGFLVTASAIGGLLGAALVGRLEERFGSARLLRAGLLVETATHLVLAITRTPWVAAGTMVVFGVHAAVWGVLALSLRQRVVPAPLHGRVNSVYMLLAMGGSAVGAPIGGFVAGYLGLAAPFWLAFAGMTVLTAAAWRFLDPGALAPDFSRPVDELRGLER